MSSVFDMDSKEAGSKLALINKYLTIILLIVFGTGIFYLYVGQNRLNDRLFDYMQNDNRNNMKVIQENKAAFETNTNVLYEIRNLLIENRTYFKQSK